MLAVILAFEIDTLAASMAILPPLPLPCVSAVKMAPFDTVTFGAFRAIAPPIPVPLANTWLPTPVFVPFIEISSLAVIAILPAFPCPLV
ncbi:hypothetical protein SD81_007555 [Tolypothrix campylonemoides VB511288]|nr:hypothetical protein SD81_007555 [Tolypothrix campylonemoides VB511288]